ncbi:hypothetical protein CMI41_02185 [Candidatus Pacearchaeota archaeon]|nr:hypothetical protein [Candidatus Pacearchaeota archaeon]|tara:strand:+ start:5706 stop:6083 length:378 start_codon:yes stop_codon:yes gene_type:complete
MRKIRLSGIGNKKDYNYYIFEKKNYSVKILGKVLSKVFDSRWKRWDEKEDKNGKWISRKINFEKRKEGHESIENASNKPKIDVFYGNKKMTLVIHCHPNLRKKFNEELEKVSYMPKTKPFKPRKK